MIRKRAFATGAAVGAAAMLSASFVAGWAEAAESSQPNAVNSPAAVAPVAPASFADLIARVAPAVVSVEVVEKRGPSSVALDQQQAPFPFPFGFGFPGEGGQGQSSPFGFGFKWVTPPGGQGSAVPVRASGSGFFISPDGYIATNNHVVKGAEKITVHTSDGRTLPATVVGRDPATDLAVIKVSGGPFKYVSFENRARPRVGDWVVAVGNPFNLGGTATAGIVSALARRNVSGSSYVDYMQIDAPINHGNSGGPTFDVEGRVVGVNTAIYTPSGGSVGIGFDIPADVAADVTSQLIAHGKVTRGYIGAMVQTLSPELAGGMGLKAAKGALVDELTPGGPAEQAGLRAGDVIVAVDGRPVDSASALTRQVALAHPGEDVSVSVLRDGASRAFTIRSGLRPSEASLASNGGGGDESGAPAMLGMHLAPDPNGGLVVQGVDPNSDAAAKGVQDGDVILRAGSRRVFSAADLSQAAAQARHAGRRSVPLLIARGGERIYLPVSVAPAKG